MKLLGRDCDMHRAKPVVGGKKVLGLLAVVAFLWSSGSIANAQIELQLDMDRSLYLKHEPITGKLIMTNRSGRDIVFGDSQGLSWLDFTVYNSQGHLISPIRRIQNEKPIIMASGQRLEHQVIINKYYPMDQIGSFRVNATVNFPQIARVFKSKVITIQITDGQPMWQEIVGVPQGHPKAGTNREFSLMTYYHGARQKSLYFRLRDSDSGMVFKTYPLGTYMAVRPPQHFIDRFNRLHVLHMSTPQRYSYSIVDIDGDLISQKRYVEKKENRPRLVTNDYGEVSILGGLTEEEAAESYEVRHFRALSERPPGMPQLTGG